MDAFHDQLGAPQGRQEGGPYQVKSRGGGCHATTLRGLCHAAFDQEHHRRTRRQHIRDEPQQRSFAGTPPGDSSSPISTPTSTTMATSSTRWWHVYTTPFFERTSTMAFTTSLRALILNVLETRIPSGELPCSYHYCFINSRSMIICSEDTAITILRIPSSSSTKVRSEL